MRLLSLFLLMCFPWLLCAQGSSAGVSGLRLPLSPRAAGLGEATVADAGQAGSTLLNPANLQHLDGAYLSIAHGAWIQDIRLNHLSAALPLSFGIVQVNIAGISVPGIEIREVPGPPIGIFTARSLRLGAGVGLEAAPGISLGVGVQTLYEKMYVEEASGVALTFGVVHQGLVEGLSLGLSVQNLGWTEAFRSEPMDLPSTVHAGAHWAVTADQFSFNLYSSLVHDTDRLEQRVQCGVEALYGELAAVRIGYQSGIALRGVSGGIGVGVLGIDLDYAYVPFSAGWGGAHLASITFSL